MLRLPSFAKYDPAPEVWEKDAEEICRHAQAVAKTRYRRWLAAHVVCIVVTILFPILAVIAMGFWAKCFATLAALAAIVSATLRPGDKATAYDAAVQDIWAARVSFIDDKNQAALIAELKRVIGLMKIRYG